MAPPTHSRRLGRRRTANGRPVLDRRPLAGQRRSDRRCPGPVPGPLPTLPTPATRDLGLVLGSPAGQAFLSGNWGWFAALVTMFVFNTVLGEELLFRALMLPRMRAVFGRWDWAANGFLFAAYHLHVPWVIPQTLLVDTFAEAGASRRYRSALIGIAVHSAQSVYFTALVLALVLR
jgi:CAAX protease family protein